jgi:hypothetical protein
MTRREQVLVIAMAGAVVWGASTLVLGFMRSHGGNSRMLSEKEQLREFAEQQRILMNTFQLTGREKSVLDEAMGGWVQSPFLLMAARTRPDARIMEFRYTGHLQVGDQHFAIINGKEYRTSEPVKSSDFVVESIQSDHVVLAATTGGRRMTVALQTSNAKRESP